MEPDATRPLRVLHLEDSPRDAEMLHDQLNADGVPVDIWLVDRRESFESALASQPFDLIISDYNIPGYDGTSAIRHAQQVQPDTPVIVISGSLGEAEAVKCLHHGATDYLLKDRLERLAPAVRRAIDATVERRSRREAEAKLRDSETRYRLLMDLAPDAILIVDRAGGIGMVNVAAERLFGYERAELLGRPIEMLIPARHPHPHEQLDLVVLRRDGTEVNVEVSLGPFEVSDERLMINVVRDITARKRLEAQFRQAQKMESVGQLAGGIAHDFNNLLTVINGTAELALVEAPRGGQLHEDLQEILRAGERAATLTRQLLAFSRKQILQLQVINLNTVVAAMESMLRRLIGEDVDLAVVPTDGQANVKADPGQIEQVIANLAVNARDAMPQGGRLTIEVQNVEIDEQYARQHSAVVPPGPYVMLSMSDTGMGMDEATQKRIFEPFFTTKGPDKGTGLGLSTVYGIVKQSNGFVWVYSEVGQGTSFKIYLPRAVAAVDTKLKRPGGSSGRGTETILLVEDVAGLRLLAKRMLESAGYTVRAAADGEEALRTLEGSEEPVHLVITDVVMPGMSGRTLAERFSHTRPELKVLYMSGYTDDAVVRHGVLSAGVSFVSKPFTAEELIRKVREVLDSEI